MKGLTLIETIVSLGVTVMITLAAYAGYATHQKSYQKGLIYVELAQNGRTALDRIGREIRQTPIIATTLPSDESQPAATELMFQDGHDTSKIQYITYYLDGSNLKRKLTHYYFSLEPDQWVPYDSKDAEGNSPISVDDEDRIIAENVSQLEFWGEKVVHIKLTTSKSDKNIQFETTVWGRNL